jgi:hypothetical protein
VWRLWNADPLGMVAVVLARVFDGRDAADRQLDRVYRKAGAWDS